MAIVSPNVQSLRDAAARVAAGVIADQAERVDRDAAWPEAGLRALAEAGLCGLHVPRRLGGHGEGLLALAAVTEALSQACPSTAICFGMHCVGTAVMAAKATPDHEERYLRPIAAGRHLTTLALSESGSGGHFYFPATRLRRDEDRVVIDGAKSFVTNGGRADSYVMNAAGEGGDPGHFSCVVVDRGSAGLTWSGGWDGLGMRGNSSLTATLDRVELPASRLLGREGDHIWYVFEIVAPYFLMAMAGSYLGVAQAALDEAAAHVSRRDYQHSGRGLGEVQVVQHRLGSLVLAVERLRALVYEAGRLGDVGDPGALPLIFSAKADAADTAVHVANEALTLCGGAAYACGSRLSRLLRDARAAHVMAPTTDVLKEWIGRHKLGLPLI